MKRRYEGERGVTLLILVVVVIIMFVIVGTLIYNTVGMVDQKELKAVYSDIEQIQQKIDSYYVQYGTLPKRDRYTGSAIPEGSRNPNDNDVYYIVDLNALPNMTLNKGTNYQLDDCYIVNEQSHTVYYTKGVALDGVTYYTIPSKQSNINLPNVIAMTDDGVPIPRGFQYITGTKDTGTVIQDIKNGNEFVWVPVSGEVEFTTSYNNSGYVDPTGQQDYIDAKESILKNKGFYIGRYELSYQEGGDSRKVDYTQEELNAFQGYSKASKTVNPSNDIQIKSENQIWNNITWTACKAVCDNMYKKNDDANSTGVVSHMMYGVEWDRTLKWLETNGKYGENNAALTTTLVSVDSTFWGNYKNAGPFTYGNGQIKQANTATLIQSGSSNYCKANNIYDLAGNLWEWTQETTSNDYCIRGGNFPYEGSNFASSQRYHYNKDYFNYSVGGRVALYIK